MQKCLHGATLSQVAEIIAKSRSKIYFQQQLLQLVSQQLFRLHSRLDGEMYFHATCVEMPLRDKLQRKLHHASAPLL
jgi:hypothetical protein